MTTISGPPVEYGSVRTTTVTVHRWGGGAGAILGANINTLHLYGGAAAAGGGVRLSSSDASQEAFLWMSAGVAEVGSITNHPLAFRTNNTEKARITTGGKLLWGTSTDNTFMTVGITIQQGGADDHTLALKSTDVAHGMTGVADTDCFAFLSKGSAVNGGLVLNGLSAGTFGIEFRGTLTTDEATRSTAALGAFIMNALKKSGTGAAGLAADRNMIVFQSNGTTRHILDSDGDSHQDVGTAWTNFDEHKDVELLNLLSAHVTRADDPLRASFGEWLTQGRDVLERIRLVRFNEDGHHFVNMSRLSMLLVGAVRQVSDRLSTVESRLPALGVGNA